MPLLRLNINSEDCLDANSLRIQFDIVNTDDVGDKTLYPINAAHAWFSRSRLLSRDHGVENIHQYNRIHQMVNMLESTRAIQDDMAESFLNDYSKGGTLRK